MDKVQKTKTSANTSFSNLNRTRKGRLDYIYVNPTVTQRGQHDLAQKLQKEIELEAELDKSFRSRQTPVRSMDKNDDSVKEFNDFCIKFMDSSKETKENVSNVLNNMDSRITEMESIQKHLEEIERQYYRFEMGLPEPTGDS